MSDVVEFQVREAERDGIAVGADKARHYAAMWRKDAAEATDEQLRLAFENKALAADWLATVISDNSAAHWCFDNSARRVADIKAQFKLDPATAPANPGNSET